MGSLLNRYRSLTALLLLLLAQLILVAYQVHTAQDVRLLRVWTVSAVTPLARLLDSARGGASEFLRNYVRLAGVERENRRLAEEVGRLKMENRFLRSELATAERAQALGAFQARTPSRTVAARVIGVGPSGDSRVLVVGRGPRSGVRASFWSPTRASRRASSARRTKFRGRCGAPGALCAVWTISRTKRRWSPASGSTPPAMTCFSRGGFPSDP
jgi:hypothetical protein